MSVGRARIEKVVAALEALAKTPEGHGMSRALVFDGWTIEKGWQTRVLARLVHVGAIEAHGERGQRVYAPPALPNAREALLLLAKNKNAVGLLAQWGTLPQEAGCVPDEAAPEGPASSPAPDLVADLAAAPSLEAKVDALLIGIRNLYELVERVEKRQIATDEWLRRAP